jgi:hypothetical protein
MSVNRQEMLFTFFPVGILISLSVLNQQGYFCFPVVNASDHVL